MKKNNKEEYNTLNTQINQKNKNPIFNQKFGALDKYFINKDFIDNYKGNIKEKNVDNLNNNNDNKYKKILIKNNKEEKGKIKNNKYIKNNNDNKIKIEESNDEDDNL